jgi:hypothetical protein
MTRSAARQDRVLERDGYNQSPQDQRGNAQYSVGRERPTGSGSLLESVKRARADIAVDDAERSQSRSGGQLSSFGLGQRSCV